MAARMGKGVRIGVDLGGTKIAVAALDAQNAKIGEDRIASPRNDYGGTIEAVGAAVERLEAQIGARGSVGIAIPGSILPATGRMQNANSTWLNGKPFQDDMSERLGRPVRMANDANCFAISEAMDGAGKDVSSLFGVILGTGCGGGYVRDKAILNGPLSVGGEWGHNPLPWPCEDEYPGPRCWCGHKGCMEVWVCGPALERDHHKRSGEALSVRQIAERAGGGDALAAMSLERHADRLARGLASVVNLLDPDMIVLGGGLSNLLHLYEELPGRIAAHIFCDAPQIKVVPPVHGDASGVRGAAWLWGLEEAGSGV